MSAISALKGYRTQFLYSLNRILNEYENGFIYQPEGKFEDLDILSEEGNYIEIVQIKNKTGQLVFSDLFSKETSFFKRAEKAILKDSNTKVKLVSYGEISNELKDKEILSKKLSSKGFRDNSIKRIIENFTFEIVDEDSLTIEVLDLLKNTSLFSDPKVALELLIYWLYTLGEKSKSIQAKELIINLERVGKFIGEQTSFNTSYNSTIVPLSTKSVEYDNLETYKSNFYYGVSAKFEHILYNLDIIRENKLELIKNAFIDNNIVFIHGASGQGKSTLAYRYLKDYTNENTVYELKISENLKETYDTISSLEALSKGLKFPITLYIDIKPQNTNWNEVIKELYGKLNLKFLVTIREEDWNRANNVEQYYNFKDIELTFDKSEAKIIYENLSQYKTDLKFTDFDESWNRFGEKGLLLEYVYLINQGNTLKSRLTEQIQNIRNKVIEKKTDELEILRYVCLSDSFNSTISFKRIVQYLKIKEPVKYIQDLQKEYLLKYSDNKEYLLGLHPIRSKILCEILFDEDEYIDINDYVSNSLVLLNEEDLHSFLLSSFDNGFNIKTCLKTLKTIEFKTWAGYNNVLKALIWKGTYDFIFEKNLNAFSRLREFLGDGWLIGLPINFTDVIDGNIYDHFKSLFSEEKGQIILEIQKEFTNKEDVFEYCYSWLKDKNEINLITSTKNELKSLGEFLFWINYLNEGVQINYIEKEILLLIENENSLEEELCLFIYALQLKINNNFTFFETLKNKAVELLRKKYNIVFLEDSEEDIDSKYFYNNLNINEKDFQKETDSLDETSVKIVQLIRYIFPNKEQYSTKGIAITNYFGVELPHDPTDKNINRKYLPVPFLANINSLMINLFNNHNLNLFWTNYIKQVTQRRALYTELTGVLVKSFSEYFKTNNYKEFINPIGIIESKIYNLSNIEVPSTQSYNKWGYKQDIQQGSFSDRYSSYKDYKKKYFNSIENFLRQIGQNVLKIYTNRTKIEQTDYNPNIAFYNIKEAFKNNVWFREEYEKFFSKYDDDSAQHKKLVETEIKNLQALFYCWNKFYNQKTKIGHNVFKDSNNLLINEKNNLNLRFFTEKQNILKKYGLSFNIELNQYLEKNLVITCEVPGEYYLNSLIIAREFVKSVLHTTNYFSIKKTFIEINVQHVIFIPLLNGFPINRKAIEINLTHLDQNIDEDFYKYFNFSNNIPSPIIEYYSIEFWNEKLTLIKDYEVVMGDVFNINYINNQLDSIKQNLSTSDTLGIRIFEDYNNSVNIFFENRILNDISLLSNIESYIENNTLIPDTLSVLQDYRNNYKIDSNELKSLQDELTNYYYIFSDKVILERLG
ncbi:hypothetical protein [Flavobacterium sp. GP15]|uniref:hypothetical protein n=1 Tax=Flavobacterium sp. GP15 TaxID=2758567 RepID=UPI00165E45A0|nr:hypothetical protein [Flavobacterium sp. GP15]